MEAHTRLLTLKSEHTLARSAASITAAIPGAFPPAGGQALEVAPAEVVLMAVEDVADWMYQWKGIARIQE